MGSPPRTGASGPGEEPEDNAAKTPEPETGTEPATPGRESPPEARHRRTPGRDDRAEKPAPGDDKAPADDVEPEEPPD